MTMSTTMQKATLQYTNLSQHEKERKSLCTVNFLSVVHFAMETAFSTFCNKLLFKNDLNAENVELTV